ncbi:MULTISPECIES: GNAT family N-acetyltransferase [Bacteria]|uniref:GNAT family N-acetyltransferase n=1 Tax=Bacteria TaxID=2 RepID=UPI003C7EC338
MNLLDARDVPADARSAQRLSDTGLSYRVVDLADEKAGEAFVRAVARGFIDPEPEAESRTQTRTAFSARRNIGVFEKEAAEEALPVATVNSWVTPLTVPGGPGSLGGEVPMWAISAVTVAATHRRRGIARNLLEGELRAAASAGIPIAGLTVSEATIYGRYGFAPAVPTAFVRVSDTRKAGWAAPAAPGRLEYLEKEDLATALGAVHERSRRLRPGQIPGWPARWERMAGLAAGDPQAASVRGVQYLDVTGEVRGVVAYTVTEIPEAAKAEMAIQHLGAETDEALSALWGFVVNHDLVTSVTAHLRPVDDPLPWLVVDQRVVEVAVHDHGWLRILDVPSALAARSYRADLDLVLQVEDPLDLAAGTWRLRVVGGAATLEATEDEPQLTVGVSTLSALYVGGVSVAQLRAAGRIQASDGVVDALDAAFRTARSAQLGIWY